MSAATHTDVSFDDADLANPYPVYARLRATPGLVRHRTEGYYLVARYDDVREAAMRTEDFSSRITDLIVRSIGLGSWVESAMSRFGPVDVLAVVDAPSHLVHRKLVTRHFARDPITDAIDRATPRVEARLHDFVARGGGDFAAEIAEPLPVELTLTMLGFPLSDAKRVRRLSDDAVSLLSGTLPRTGRMRVFTTALELYVYSCFRFEWAKRRGETGAPLGDALVAAAREGSLGTREAASIVMQLLIAGSDSTASMLGSAVRMLAESPELADRLRADPTLVGAFVEECLRLEAPFQGHFRVARHATDLAGVPLRPGDRLMLLWASANRDPEAFEAPESVVLDRKTSRKPQLAFGHGAHLCVGAGLARAAGRMVLERLLARTSGIELATSSLTHKPSGFVRTLTSLPIRVSPRGPNPEERR